MSNNPYGSTDVDPYDYDYQPPNYGNPTSGYVPPVGAMSQPAQINIEPMGASLDDEALRLKAMELARREAELEKREHEVQNLDNANAAKKNFPKCYPIVYHNISGIPPEFLRRKLAYWGFISAIVFQVVVLLNALVAYITTFYPPAGLTSEVTVMTLIQYCVISTVMAVISGAGHFFLGYWTLYKAMDIGAIPRFILFFIGYGVAILYCALGVAGYLTYGFSGIVTAIYYFPTTTTGSIPGFVCNLVMAVIWFALMCNFIVIFILVIKVFRALKGSFGKIKEYGAGLVQSGAVSAIGSAVKSSLTGGNKSEQV